MRDPTKTKRYSPAVQLLALLALSLVLSCPLYGQVAGATLSGKVTDASGAVMPGAKVSIKNTGTGVARDVAADASGLYSVPNLLPGSYEITASAPGFSTQVRSGITLTVGEQQVLDITMQVGQTAEKVEVTGEAPVVELSSSALGAVVNSATAVELPLNGRDWTALAALEPGVTNVGNLQQAVGSTSVRANRGFGSQLAVAGTRPQLNNYRIDGISGMDGQGGSPGSVLGVSLGVDAIGEFSVLTSNYSAEYGRTAGGVINAITKSGTNTFHGSLYWFLRNKALDKPTFPDVVIPPFRRNQFGGSAGGPIQKNKTFFFADYEGYRESRGLTSINTVPTADFLNGIIHNPDGTTTQLTIDPKIKPFFAFYPKPNGAPVPPGNFANYVLVSSTTLKEDYVTGRIDRTFSDKNTLHGTYLYDNGITIQPAGLNAWTFGNTSIRHFGALEETHVFGPALVNAVRLGFNRVDPNAGAGISVLNPLAGDHSFATFPGLWSPGGGPPGGTGITGFNGNTILHHVWNSFQAYDDAFLTNGVHTFKFGFAFERMQTNSSIVMTPNGSFSFATPAAFLQNQPTSFTSASPTGRATIGARQSLLAGYIQDDWRMRKNLTLNLGLRYEMVTVPSEVHNRLTNVQHLTDPTPHFGSPYFSNPTLRNFSPKVGLAWDPFGSGKTSVRAAFGIFDMLPLNYLFFWGEDRTAPYTLTIAQNPLPQGSFPSGAGSFNPANAAVLSSSLEFNFVQPNPPRSYMMIWNLSIQRQLTANTSMTVGYVGSHGVHTVDRGEEFNEVRPTSTPSGLLWPTTPGALLNPNYGQIVGDYWGGGSEYDALTAQVTKRLSHGFQVGGSYTWSKSMDTGSSSTLSDNFTNSIVNLHSYCNSCRRSVSDFDIGQNFVANYVWDLPTLKNWGSVASHVLGGWEVGGIISLASGSPFTPRITGDPLGMRGSSAIDYPSFSGAAGCSTPVNPGAAFPATYLKLDCFALPSAPELGTQCVAFASKAGTCKNLQGNVGRNSVRAPGRETWDFSLLRNNHIKENFNVQFRAEMFNVLNRRNLGPPAIGLFDANGASLAGAGQIRSAAGTARQIQFALKLIW